MTKQLMSRGISVGKEQIRRESGGRSTGLEKHREAGREEREECGDGHMRINSNWACMVSKRNLGL